MGVMDRIAPSRRVSTAPDSLLVLTILLAGVAAQYVQRPCSSFTNSECSVLKSAGHSSRVERPCTSITNSKCSVPKSAGHSSRSLGQRLLRSTRLVTRRDDDEVVILMAFRSAITNDSSGVLNGWNASSRTPCHWYGVTCHTARQHVTALRLNPYPYLEGTISPELGGLKFLETLDLASNLFTGSIPPSLGNCSRLSILDLGYNALGGEIPNELGRLPNLTYLRISSYDFGSGVIGVIPASLRNCSNLQTLDIQSDSRFTQRFPSWMGSLTLLSELRLSGFMIGEIPPSVGNCSSLTVLGLSDNQLTTIPREIGLLSRLQQLYLGRNNLSGSIPPEVFLLSRLQKLYLWGNSLSGSIPTEIGLLSRLQHLNLQQNNLSGSFPAWVGNLSELTFLHLSDNKLTGPLPPAAMANLSTSLESFDISRNHLSGSIPVSSFRSLANIEMLEISHNYFSGPVPHMPVLSSWPLVIFSFNFFTRGETPIPFFNGSFSMVDLSHNLIGGSLFPVDCSRFHLEYLNLDNNLFTGSFPAELTNCTTMSGLRLNDNLLSGTLPAALGRIWLNATDFPSFLDLSNNNFSGQIPVSLGMASQLDVLRLNNNSLTGPVSVDFRNFSLLTSLRMSDNQLSGTIPKSLENCTALQLLDLCNNRFSGNVPDFAYQLPFLRVLKLGSNRLEGDILPAWIFRLPQLQVLDLSHNRFNGSIPVGLTDLQGMIHIQPNSGSPTDDTTLQEQITLGVKGSNLYYAYILLTTTYLDLSSNFFSGEILPLLGNLLGLKFLNLSNNNLTGFINESLAIPGLESLDLSGNDLSGPIPSSFYDLSSLGDLNLSRNNLSGSIPGTKFDAPHYLPGNNLLCGVVISTSCPPPPGPGPVSYPRNSRNDMEFSDIISLVAVEIGAALGFVSVVALLVLSDKARAWISTLLPLRRKNYMRKYGLFAED